MLANDACQPTVVRLALMCIHCSMERRQVSLCKRKEAVAAHAMRFHLLQELQIDDERRCEHTGARHRKGGEVNACFQAGVAGVWRLDIINSTSAHGERQVCENGSASPASCSNASGRQMRMRSRPPST